MDDSLIRKSLLGQYRAALEMLQRSVELCPEELWFSSEYKNRFWHIAYHSAFYTHLYVQQTEADFKAWSKHRPDSNYFGPQPWAKDKPYQLPEPYSKQDVQEYLSMGRAEVEKNVPITRLEEGSGFSWLAFTKLETHLYNIRHLQHHTGQLMERLRTAANVGVGWVGTR